MRGLTTRNVRPCLQHGRYCFTFPLVRSATSPPLPRAVTCADAFLFFLPSVLTAALVIDYTGKKRRRAEWDNQIAIAQEEADRLRQRHLEAWSRIQRRSVSNGAWQQRRSLYTATQSTHELDEETERMMDPLGRQTEINAGDQEADSAVEPGVDLSAEDNVKKQERFGRLLATKLALELMLKLRLGRSSRNKAHPTVDPNSLLYHESMDYIVQELDKVVGIMQSLEISKVPWGVQMPDEFHQKQQNMALQVTELCDKYRNVEIHLPDFVMSFVQLVTDFKIGLPNQSYVEIMRVLSFHQVQSTMARHVEDALLDSHQRLDCYTISNILYHHGMIADSLRFSQFLERLTRADQHPRPRAPWYRLHVNDIEICVPKTKDGHIITALIRTALQCRQSTVAEAYALVFLDRDRIEKYSGIHKWFILSNFLQSYGNWMSWESGQRWLRLAVTWLSEFVTSEEHVLGRVVLRMLDFCVACGKHDDYEAIMRAVVAANMLIPELTPGAKVKISARMNAIRRDWVSRLATTDPSQYVRLRPSRDEQTEIFASMLAGRWTSDSQLPVNKGQQPKTEWMEPGYLAYNPILAEERLAQASGQRQETINHGFKGFKSREPMTTRAPFPPAGEQNIMIKEPIADGAVASLSSEAFVSPFFQVPQEDVPTTRQIAAGEPANYIEPIPEVETASHDTGSSVAALEKAFKAAESNLTYAQNVEKQRYLEFARLRRELTFARGKPKRTKSAAMPTADHDDNDLNYIRSSASGWLL